MNCSATVARAIADHFRRDFQNGIVLVNPTNATLTLNLGKTYQQVTGTGGGILTRVRGYCRD